MNKLESLQIFGKFYGLIYLFLTDEHQIPVCEITLYLLLQEIINMIYVKIFYDP